MKNFVTLIPIYQNILNEYEKMSIYNTIDKFLTLSDTYFICGKSFDINEFYNKNDFDDSHKINYIYYNDEYFNSVQGYNDLLLDKEFYNYFANDYKYMLIVQTDAYIFDRFKIYDFIAKDYNFIGAPIIISNYLDCFKFFNRGIYYNGGLSLRKIQFCVDCLNDINFINKYKEYNSCADEDLIFSSYEQCFYNSPDYIESLKFSIDNQMHLYLPVINLEQPFGIHHFWNNDDNGYNKLEILEKMKWI